MTKTGKSAVVAIGAAYIVGLVTYPPPEKKDSNLLMRALWPVVAGIELTEHIFKERKDNG